MASQMETLSTGWVVPSFLNSEGLKPITSSNCACVTSYLPIENDVRLQ